MSEVKVNKISPRTNCGTVQLGDSGDTITIPSGATITNNGTQTGFGRTGTVDWDTTAKTTSFTATNGDGFFINTTSGAITMTLPASPSSGDIVAFKDYANTFDTNNLTIARNGSNIGGDAIDAVVEVEGQSGTLVYVDSTQGWMIVNASTDADLPKPTFVTATGGTITTSGNCKIHTFTGPGTFCVSSLSNTPANNRVSYMVVAGGGGGAQGHGGGAGAGGFRESQSPTTPYTTSPLVCAGAISVTATGFPITVGGGGPAGNKSNGSNSSFSTITSAGGGGGGYESPGSAPAGAPGGSGGGGGSCGTSPGSGGTGNSPPVTPAQGKNGGNGVGQPGSFREGGGGGGATVAGANGAYPGGGGNGGTGATTSISGSPTAYAGGGGGGAYQGTKGSGGTGGGGSAPGGAGTANTGGGGGSCGSGGNGGSGVVVIRYKYQ